MKLLLRGACALALILVLVGLALLLSAGDSNSATALTRIELAAGVVNIGAKLAIIVAALAAFFAGQQSEWGWVAALVILGLVTLFSGPLSALTNAGNILFFAAPLAVALLALIYSFRIHGNLAPVNAWWRASR
ncbi:MAG TPA: hypothetical protein VFU60_01980 [Ktedonobacterales bacterium]|jgi:hypothetical protein|nr:hypothetical protein [Ktedonobacterales bacterium]